MSDDDIEALPFEQLRYFLAESGYLGDMLPATKIREYLRIGLPPLCNEQSSEPLPSADKNRVVAQPTSQPQAEISTDVGQPTVSQAVLAAWWAERKLDPANHNASLKADWTAARDAFPGKKIARARIESLRGPQPVGRKRKLPVK